MTGTGQVRTAIAGLVVLGGLGVMDSADAVDRELTLSCEGADRGTTGPVGYFRFEVSVGAREYEGRHLSLDRFRGGFETGEPHYIFEPITRLGGIELSYCNRADWPSVCTGQLPSSRELMVGAMSDPGDPVFLSGYVGCPFCPLAPLQISTDDAGEISFRYFEFDLVEGTCRSRP